MRIRLTVPAFVLLSALAACSGGYATPENDPVTVCEEQAAMAKAGRVDGRDITITCPSRDSRTATGNSYDAKYEMYQAGNAAMIAVGTAK
ncbi:hypothetical protein [Paracoccus sp. IB05]|uniref:hypothetical protein n=1 Tax=Paracoccus sp. IB05 TaxID=2779367 RepID=UPI0018E6E6D4|nr:hypothetical protein [Paracoccus sp. IB05]MBJ2150462.1 hypothetical protein [Paracoccus sp. IB05]